MSATPSLAPSFLVFLSKAANDPRDAQMIGIPARALLDIYEKGTDGDGTMVKDAKALEKILTVEAGLDGTPYHPAQRLHRAWVAYARLNRLPILRLEPPTEDPYLP